MKTVRFACPLCAPTREAVATGVRSVLDKYHFKLGAIHVDQAFENGKPAYWYGSVDFTDKAVGWGEYVLLRRGYEVLGKLYRPMNKVWAAPYLQYRPESGPWHGVGCKPEKGQMKLGRPMHGVPVGNPPPAWDDQDRPREWWKDLKQSPKSQPKPRTSQRTSRKRGGGWRDWFGF